MTNVGPSRKILVIGIGNADRGDDGVGPAVAAGLAGRLPHNVSVRTRGGDMLALIDDWAGFDAVVCIDAAQAAGAPGRLCRVDLLREELPRDISLTSSHAFGLVAAVALARTLARAPEEMIVFAIEGLSFEPGAGLTPAVSAAVRTGVDLVLAEIVRLHDRREEALTHA